MMYKVFGKSWLFWLNFLICQWLFFRIYRGVNTETRVNEQFGILLPIVPLTGWWTDYIPSKKYLQYKLIDV